MAKYAYIVAVSEGYIPALDALLGSLNEYGAGAEVLLLAWQLPDAYLESLEKYNYKISVIPSTNPDRDAKQATTIGRYWVASKVADDYDAVCVLDADMFLLADCTLFFKLAAAGFIVVGSNGMLIDFGRNQQERYGVDLGIESLPYPEVHSSAPIFISKADTNWFEELVTWDRTDSWDDFLLLNLLGIKLGKTDHMVVMPPYAFTGLHHWQVKPETALRYKGDLVVSGTEERVYMVHGRWWDKDWINGVMAGTMKSYFANEQMGSKCQQRTEAAIKLCCDKYVELSGGGVADVEDH